MRTGQQVLILQAFLNKKREEKLAQPNFATTSRTAFVHECTWLSNKLTNNWDTGCQQMRYCLDFVAGTAGMRYRTFFQKREYRTAAQWDPAFHLMGALTSIKCCKLRGKCLYSSGPISPIWMRITLISPWTSTWWRPTWKVCQGHKSLNEKLLSWNRVQKLALICYPRGFGVRDSTKGLQNQFWVILPASQTLPLLQFGTRWGSCRPHQARTLGWGWQSAACSLSCGPPPAPGGLWGQADRLSGLVVTLTHRCVNTKASLFLLP